MTKGEKNWVVFSHSGPLSGIQINYKLFRGQHRSDIDPNNMPTNYHGFSSNSVSTHLVVSPVGEPSFCLAHIDIGTVIPHTLTLLEKELHTLSQHANLLELNLLS